MPLKARRSGLASSARAEFSEADFTDIIRAYGYDVRWSKFAKCPNDLVDQDDHHALDCPLCDNRGRIFYDARVTRMIGSSLGLNSKVAPESLYKMGTVYFTTYPGDRPSFRDKIELLFSELRYSERYRIDGSQLSYKARYQPLRVLWAMTNLGDTLSPSSITVGLDRSLTFSALPPGTQFVSVAYDHHPVYMVTDVMHIVRDSRTTQSGSDTPTEFNRQVVGSLEFTRDTADPNLPGEL